MNANELKSIKQTLKTLVDAGFISGKTMDEISAIKDNGKQVETEKYLTRKQVMERLQVSMQTLVNWELGGKLAPIKLAGVHLIRYKQSDIDGLCEYKVVQSGTTTIINN